MTYIYAAQIAPKTQEDVNFAFRNAQIAAELIVGDGGTFFVAPVLSWSSWQSFPQSADTAGAIDPKWNGAVAEGVQFMANQGWLDAKPSAADWHSFDVPMRCSKMEAFQRAKDLPYLSSLVAKG